jgi:hypothetical protein
MLVAVCSGGPGWAREAPKPKPPRISYGLELGLRGGPSVALGQFLFDPINRSERRWATISLVGAADVGLAFDRFLSVILAFSYTGRWEVWEAPGPGFHEAVHNSSITRIMPGLRYRLTWAKVLPYVVTGAGLGLVGVETSYGPVSNAQNVLHAGASVFVGLGLEWYPKGTKVAVALEPRLTLFAAPRLSTTLEFDGGVPFGMELGPVEAMLEIQFGVMTRT